MLTKVTSKVRRRSLTPQDSTIAYRIQAVTVAPDLLRWSDFTSPFPPVALGGYTRYYASRTANTSTSQEPKYCPKLSRYPDFASSSSSTSTPSSSKLPHTRASNTNSTKIPLFPLSPKVDEPSTPPKRPLTVIHEASRESMSSTSPGSARVGPSSLRRRRRQLLRTPSIERDFALTARHLFSPSAQSLDQPSPNDKSPTKDAASGFPLHIRSLSLTSNESSLDSLHHSEDSHGSEETHRTTSDESAQSDEYPITPTLSMDSGDVRRGYGDMLVLGDTGGRFEFRVEDMDAAETETDPSAIPSSPPTLKVELEHATPRPESWTSFSTARSAFGPE